MKKVLLFALLLSFLASVSAKNTESYDNPHLSSGGLLEKQAVSGNNDRIPENYWGWMSDDPCPSCGHVLRYKTNKSGPVHCDEGGFMGWFKCTCKNCPDNCPEDPQCKSARGKNYKCFAARKEGLVLNQTNADIDKILLKNVESAWRSSKEDAKKECSDIVLKNYQNWLAQQKDSKNSRSQKLPGNVTVKKSCTLYMQNPDKEIKISKGATVYCEGVTDGDEAWVTYNGNRGVTDPEALNIKFTNGEWVTVSRGEGALLFEDFYDITYQSKDKSKGLLNACCPDCGAKLVFDMDAPGMIKPLKCPKKCGWTYESGKPPVYRSSSKNNRGVLNACCPKCKTPVVFDMDAPGFFKPPKCPKNCGWNPEEGPDVIYLEKSAQSKGSWNGEVEKENCPECGKTEYTNWTQNGHVCYKCKSCGTKWYNDEDGNPVAIDRSSVKSNRGFAASDKGKAPDQTVNKWMTLTMDYEDNGKVIIPKNTKVWVLQWTGCGDGFLVEYKGNQYDISFDYFEESESKSSVSRGMKECPECGKHTGKSIGNGNYRCTSCGTEWHYDSDGGAVQNL